MSVFNASRKLRRVPDRGPLGGVCAGFAYWLGSEAWLVRLLWVLLFFFSGGSITLFYILFWIILRKWDSTPDDFDTVTGD